MAIKSYKPTSAGRRACTSLVMDDITVKKPVKSLTVSLKHSGGRNNTGMITCRHVGGGHKRFWRVVDFKRDKDGIIGTVATIEYDPNRSANIALINYADGERRYIICPKGLVIGQQVVSGPDVDIKVGNALPLEKIPEGTFIHCLELKPGKGAQLVRSAGSSAQILGKEGKYVTVRLTSGEVRKFLNDCRATIGEVGNEDHALVNLGKAGRKRWLGVRPTVRGAVMNPCDHPHGGGEGKNPVGRDAPRTPWGKKHMGISTRSKKKPSSKMIVRRRNGR